MLDLITRRNLGFRLFPTAKETERYAQTWDKKEPHIRPDAVYIISLGNSWEEGAWQKVLDMVEYTNNAGICCWFYEQSDSSATLPYTNLNPMRNFACTMACNSGAEWLLLVENDILPNPDMLVKLIDRQMPVVVPYMVEETNNNRPIASPEYPPNCGLKAILWSVFSCVLINTGVLRCFPYGAPFEGTNAEGTFYERLHFYGHRAYQDTDVFLKLAKPPSRHGAAKSLDELWEIWSKVREKTIQKPNRQAIDPNNPNQYQGIYLPPLFAQGLMEVEKEINEKSQPGS